LPKRYVLFVADSDLTDTDMKLVESILLQRYGQVKVIPVKRNDRALIVKTSNLVAASMREERTTLKIGGKTLGCALTSGAIGNLKRRAAGRPVIGEVPQ